MKTFRSISIYPPSAPDLIVVLETVVNDSRSCVSVGAVTQAIISGTETFFGGGWGMAKAWGKIGFN